MNEHVSRHEHDADIEAVKTTLQEHDHAARERLDSLRQVIEEKFKSLHTRFLLYLGAAVGIIRFDIPKEITAGALAVIAVKALVGLFIRN